MNVTRKPKKGSIWDAIPPELPYHVIQKEWEQWVKDRKDARLQSMETKQVAAKATESTTRRKQCQII
jgi:hypothetical protein